MRGPASFSPRVTATELGVVGLPVRSLAVLGIDVVFLTTGAAAGIAAGVAFVILGAVLGVLAVVTPRGWFPLEVGPEAFALVGLFGLGRFEVPWSEVETVGLVRWRGARILCLRPARPWASPPTPLALRWDTRRRLLLTCGVERWSRPTHELLGTLREHAADRWRDPVDEPISD